MSKFSGSMYRGGANSLKPKQGYYIIGKIDIELSWIIIKIKIQANVT